MKRRTWMGFVGLAVMLAPGLGYANPQQAEFFNAIRSDDVDKVNAMLSAGADPNMLDEAGQCALVVALQSEALRVADMLIANARTDLNYLNAAQESALMFAALKGLMPQAQALIARGAYVNKTGWAPLHYSVTQPKLEMVVLMIENYAYIDAESPNGTTPLMMAARYGTDEQVRYLLDEGADPMMRNQLNMTAYDFALQAEQKTKAQMILQAMRDLQPSGW